jgi:phosphatidate phosphatase LPIN
LASGANDVVVVRQDDGSLASTPFHVRIGKLTSLRSLFASREGRDVELIINDAVVPIGMIVAGSGAACFASSGTATPSPADLDQMGLRLGPNSGVYRVQSLDVTVAFTIFVLAQTDRLVVTDVDGTVTKSNAKGVIGPVVGLNEDQLGVVELFERVARNGYKLVYLTARPMGVEKDTKKYLFKVRIRTLFASKIICKPILL